MKALKISQRCMYALCVGFAKRFANVFAFLLIHEIGFIGQGDLTLGKGGIVGLYVLRRNR